MKICSRCNENKDEKCFYARKDRPTGFSSACIECLNDGRRSSTKDNKEKLKEQRKIYYENHKENFFEYGKKYRDKLTEERLEKDREYRRRWYSENRSRVIAQRKEQVDRINIWQREYEKKRDKEKLKANRTLNVAISNGSVTRPLTCSICGTDKYKIQGHHSDYTKPLEVIWVCTFCHSAIHKELKKREIC